MSSQYELTADVEVMLEALKRHADKSPFYTMAHEEKDLRDHTAKMVEAQKTVDYRAKEVAASKEKVAKTRRKVAQLINALVKAGCPEEIIKKQWKDYDNKFILPWPNGHDLAEWIKAE